MTNIKLLSKKQATKMLNIDPRTFDKYIRSNPDFKCILLGKRERYLESELIKYIMENNKNI